MSFGHYNHGTRGFGRKGKRAASPQYPDNHACFKCGRPGDWCQEYRVGGSSTCKHNDIGLGIALMSYSIYERYYREKWAEGMDFRGSEDGLIDWLIKPRMVFAKKSTNAFYIFTEVVKIHSVRR